MFLSKLTACVESLKIFGKKLEDKLSESKDKDLRRMTWSIPDMKKLKDNLFNQITDYVNNEMGEMSSKMNEAFEVFNGKIFSTENV